MISTLMRARAQGARTTWRLPISYDEIGVLALSVDVVLIAAASGISGLGYHLARLGYPGDMTHYVGVGAALSAVVLPALKLRGLYQPVELLNLNRQLMALSAYWLGAFVFLSGVAFSLKIGSVFSRGAVLSFAIAGWTALALHRAFWCWLLHRGQASGRLHGKKVALLRRGEGARPGELMKMLDRHGFRVIHDVMLPSDSSIDSSDFRRTVQQILSSFRGSEIDEIFIASPLQDAQEILQMQEQLRVAPLRVRFIPDAATGALINKPWQAIGDSVAVEIQRPPLTRLERALKRTLDIIVAGGGLLVLSPLIALLGVAVRLETSGPAFFKQRRHGFNGREFTILKFRSMVVLEDGPVVTQAKRNDNRVTRLGLWLRRTSLDEVPQLFNVLRGEMSIIGPRPHAIAHDNHYDQVIADYALRQHMKPGLTGWAQVHGFRGETPTVDLMERRVEFDLWYIANWTLWRDVQILARTVFALFRDRNAY